MTTEQLPPAPAGARQQIKRFVPRPLWKALRRGGKRSREALCRGLIDVAVTANGAPGTLCHLYDTLEFTPETIIRGFCGGMFPVPEHRTGVVRWQETDPRCVIPIHDFHVPRSLQRVIRKGTYEIRVDTDPRGVLAGCATPAPGREDTWISPAVVECNLQLFEMGVVHTVETWQDGVLVGGLFGLALGAFFVGESQFHVARDAGKVATVALFHILQQGGFVLNDVGWGSSFLDTFGAVYLPREEFTRQLAVALTGRAHFAPLTEWPYPRAGEQRSADEPQPDADQEARMA